MNYTQAVKRGGIKGGIAGAIMGGGLGASIGGIPKHRTDADGKKQRIPNKERKAGAIIVGTALGAYGGHKGYQIGKMIGGAKFQYNRSARKAAKSKTMPDWLHGASTRAEARKKYHKAARSAHPDLGGDPEKIKKINSDWGHWEGHFKTATIRAFYDELAKLANTGAVIGGLAGAAIMPGGLKAKLVGAAGGATLGGITHGAGRFAHRNFIEDPAHREHAELYGYVPSAAQSIADSPYQASRFI